MSLLFNESEIDYLRCEWEMMFRGSYPISIGRLVKFRRHLACSPGPTGAKFSGSALFLGLAELTNNTDIGLHASTQPLSMSFFQSPWQENALDLWASRTSLSKSKHKKCLHVIRAWSRCFRQPFDGESVNLRTLRVLELFLRDEEFDPRGSLRDLTEMIDWWRERGLWPNAISQARWDYITHSENVLSRWKYVHGPDNSKVFFSQENIDLAITVWHTFDESHLDGRTMTKKKLTRFREYMNNRKDGDLIYGVVCEFLQWGANEDYWILDEAVVNMLRLFV